MENSVSAVDYIEDENKELYIKLCQNEEKVEKELELLLSRNCQLENKIQSIVNVLPSLEIISSDAKQLSDMISFASNLAENVSHKVRKLDTTRSRVSECQQRVHDLLDLQLCCDGVQLSMTNGDFEKAAAHVHRYLSMDRRLLEKTADDVNQDSATVNNSITLLQEAAKKLRHILTVKFTEAVKTEDMASVDRFFKLFPLLEMHEEGLEKYSEFLMTKIQASARSNLRTALETSSTDKRYGVIFADLITLVFEDIAKNIEVHQPLVETYYGPGRLLKVVKKLQEECDKQCKLILAEMRRLRQLEKLKNNINERNKVQKVNPKDMDQLLAEITIIQSRFNLYGDTANNELSMNELETIVKKSEVSRSMQDLLNSYLGFEHFFMEESIRKAISMDFVDSGGIISTMIDDVFFIVKKCIRRASSTANIDAVCVVINNACAIMENELCSALMNSMKQGFPSGYLDLTQAYNVMIQGRIQATDTEQAKTTFLAHLNNIEICSEYINTLCMSLANEVQCSSDLDRNKLEGCLAGFSRVCATQELAQELGIQQLSNIAIKPRIASWLDSFLTVSHNLSEDEFSSYEANDPFVSGLIRNIDNLLSEFKNSLTSNNYERLVNIIAIEINNQMEKVIMKTEFNRLGGLALDKEVRALISYLSSATSWSIRDKFSRITQIATVLNLEKISEISEYRGSSHSTWKLSLADIKNVMKLRVDFQNDEILRLKI